MSRKTLIMVVLISKTFAEAKPSDPLVFIANPVESQMPGHWIPLSIVKTILEGTTKSKMKLHLESTEPVPIVGPTTQPSPAPTPESTVVVKSEESTAAPITTTEPEPAESPNEPLSADDPDTEAPATEPPATEPPATEPPAVEPPAADPPATEPPATEPPATEPPDTDPPPPAPKPPPRRKPKDGSWNSQT